MPTANRREFLHTSAGLMGAAALAQTSLARAAGANDRITVALIGCGGRGRHVAGVFSKAPDIDLAYLCDVDPARLTKANEENLGGKAQSVSDLRRVLDDKRVDAVIVATPDHWHAPASILACDAGKHVYVEKP